MKKLRRPGFILFFVITFLMLLVCFLPDSDLCKKKIKNSILSIISVSQKKGVIELDEVKWCSLPINYNLDQGGVPFGIQDITHPSIEYISGGWNGFSYWLAATPYPESLPTGGEPYENACIFYANESENEAPVFFERIKQNPIIFKGVSQYNSDPDIYFDSTSSKLYCLTRKRYASDFETSIVLQESSNGQTWSVPKTIIEDHGFFLSPCLYKIGDEFMICGYQVESIESKKTVCLDIWKSESLNDPNFIFTGSFKWNSDYNVWHGDIFKWRNKYFLIACGSNKNFKYLTGQRDVSKYLFLGSSDDGLNFTTYERPLLKANGVYRSSAFIKNDSILVCYVSFHNRIFEKGKYISGNRIGLIEYPITKLLEEISGNTY